MKKNKKRKKNLYSIKNFLTSIIFILVIIIILLSLYICYRKIVYSNYLYNKQIIELLKGSSIEEKKKYIDDINEKINNIDDIISQYNTEEINEKIEDLTNKNDVLAESIQYKQEILNNKKNTYQLLLDEYNKKTTYIIPNIITYNQYPNYPNGCEAVALYIVLKYYNVDVDIESVMNALPKGNTPYMVNGIRYGGDPNYEFLGDPRSASGWGIYDKGLAITANNFKSDIINGTGMEFSKIYDLIKENRPVIVWTSIDLKDPYIAASWIADTTGETIYWKNWNHALVVIGYNNDNIIVSDPINGTIRYFDKKKFIMIYDFMGRRALYY